MKSISVELFSFLLCFSFITKTLAQTSIPNVIQAIRTEDNLSIDGSLSEPVWQKAKHIEHFTQRELHEGQPATERTEVAVVYDLDYLYIGVWCYDREPGKLVAQKMKRDFDYDTEDNFEIIIDTYHDQRNGYLFVTNPNGARTDALIQDNGRYSNTDWDGVWMVKTQVTGKGWFAEFAIPFSTLRFSSAEKQVWGINFERNIRRKHEQDLWQGWSRDSELEQVARAGTLTGLHALHNITLAEIKPYGITGADILPNANNSTTDDIGGDVNYLITPTMKLNLTVNTDFAQVESDRAQVNLTRFSLFFPEKREFFLEGRNYFDFGLGRSIQPFYTRRIGLSADRAEIPIIAGARLLGKMGNTTLGGMSIQTAKKDSTPTANYSVLRWKQDIWQESSIGLLGVGKFDRNHGNAVYGADFLYSTSHFHRNKNLSVGVAFAQSYTSNAAHKTGSAQRIFIDYPNDNVDFSAVWDRSGDSFNPEVGFLRRTSYQMYNADFRIKPRPKFLPWIRQFSFKPFDFNYYIDDNTHDLQSFWSEFRPLGFSTKSGEFFEFNIQRSAENITEDFEIHDGVVIPTDEYWYTHYELQFGTFQGRPAYGFIFVNWGDFYNGKRTELAGRIGWRLNKRLSLSADYQRNDITLPSGNFTVNELSGRIEFAVNPNLFGSIFGQWNNDDNEVLLNFRFNWIPTPGTNLFFVINQSYDTQQNHWRMTKTTMLTKLIWRFVI